MTKRAGQITAGELMKQLESDPEYLARLAEHESWKQKNRARFQAITAPIIQDILAAGLRIESLDDLINTGYAYPEAIPVLLKHLPRPYPPDVKDAIGRSLTVKEAKGFGRVVLDEFKRTDGLKESTLKFTLANTLWKIADASLVEEMIQEVDRQENGEDGRTRLIDALGRFSDPRILEGARRWVKDPSLAKEAMRVIKKFERLKSHKKKADRD